MKINVQYFAKLREERGLSNETLNSEAKTALELFNEIKEKYHFSMSHENLRVAVNEEFCEWDSTLKDNDMIVFIPPVAGG